MPTSLRRAWLVFGISTTTLVTSTGCSSAEEPIRSRGPEAAAGDSSAISPAPGNDDGSGRSAPASPSRAAVTGCHEKPAPGSAMPPPPSPYAGTCPKLEPASQILAFTDASAGRRFMVVRPKDERRDETLPIVFMWHWLSGAPETAKVAFEAQAAADALRFVAVIPESKDDTPWRWPFDILASDDRVEEEARFFDDMLSCVAQQIPNVALHCVSTMGLSAGALFSAQLVSRRSSILSSFVSLSGGIGGVIRDLSPTPANPVPALVLWGGPTDQYKEVVDFDAGSKRLLAKLAGHAVVECIHDCGHAIPPFETALKLEPAYRFAMDHPYGLSRGASPYAEALPKEFPAWCAFGAGHAVPRNQGGDCPGL
jgi:poly(3-hydroxybutyrate) depolymerase